jgi:Glycosyltransferase family 87
VSARDRFSAILLRWSGRPTLMAVAVMNVITGVGVAAILQPMAGWDAATYRRCAVQLAEGATEFCGFLYSPLTALVARPLTWVSPTMAMIAMTLIGVTIVVIGVALETRGQAAIDRVLFVVAALAFAPVVYELLLGQTTLLIAAALYPVARRPDGLRNGVPFGIVLALAPKPLLLPILVWMLVWRRKALSAALLTALSLTGLGIALLGLEQYREWLLVLMGAGRETAAGTFTLSTHNNASLWPLTPVTFAIACAVGAMTLWAIARDSSRGFVASLFAGLLLAPYSLLYAFSILLLAVKPALTLAPRATRVLALIANPVAVTAAVMTIWSLAAFWACLSFSHVSASQMADRRTWSEPPPSP